MLRAKTRPGLSGIRVGDKVQAMMPVQSRPPEYPPPAKQAGIQGTVKLNASIGKDGRAIEAQVVDVNFTLLP